MQIDNAIIWGNTNRIDHDYRVGYKLITLTKSEYKLKTPYRYPYEIVQTWTNVTITLQTGVLENIINTHHIMPF